MSIRLPDAQVNALAIISSRHVEIGMQSIFGIKQATTNALQLRGLIDTVGVRRPEWELTDAGAKVVSDLVAEGRLVRESVMTETIVKIDRSARSRSAK